MFTTILFFKIETVMLIFSPYLHTYSLEIIHGNAYAIAPGHADF